MNNELSKIIQQQAKIIYKQAKIIENLQKEKGTNALQDMVIIDEPKRDLYTLGDKKRESTKENGFNKLKKIASTLFKD